MTIEFSLFCSERVQVKSDDTPLGASAKKEEESKLARERLREEQRRRREAVSENWKVQQ